MDKDSRFDNVIIEFGTEDLNDGLLNKKLMEVIDKIKINYEKRHPIKNKAISDQEKDLENLYYESIRKTKSREEFCKGCCLCKI